MQNLSPNQQYLPQNNLYQPNSIIYSQQSLQPYNNQEFLHQTFHYKTDYINAFNTLSHQEKLQMYLSVEEMKMMGKMNDRQGYERILKQIARRVGIIKPQLNNRIQQKQQIDWGSKLQNLCENHLKKMQHDDLLDNIPVNFTMPQVQKEEKIDFISGQNKVEEQDWEWNDETTTQEKKQQMKLEIVQKNEIPAQKVENDEEDWQWEEPAQQNTNQLPQNNEFPQQPVFASENNNMGILNTVVFQKPQQIDIWELNVEEEEKRNKKNIARILHSEAVQINFQNRNSIESPQKIQKQAEEKSENEDDFDDFVQENPQISIPPQTSNNSGNMELIFPVTETNTQISNEPQVYNQEMDKAYFDFGDQNFQSANSIASFNQIPTTKTISDMDLDLFEMKEEKKEESQQIYVMGQFYKKTSEITNQIVTEPQLTYNISDYQAKTNTQNSNFTFDNFDFLDIPQKKQESKKEQQNIIEDFNVIIQEPNNTEISIKTQTLLPGLNTSILEPLLVHSTHNYLQQCLRKKVFDLDIKFYKKGQKMIASLGYENSNDFQFLKSQQKLCEKIVQLTEMYTTAVQEDEEEVVKETIAQSKKKYSQLNTKKTTLIIEKYIKMNGKGLIFRVGQLILAAGVSNQLIQKTVSSRNILTNLTVLYGLQTLNTLNVVSTFTHKLVAYFQNQYLIYKENKGSLQAMNENLRTQIESKEQYQNYKNGLSKIANLCRRMLNITKICSNQKFHANGLKLGKELKEVDAENEDDLLIPVEYQQALEKVAKKGQNVYTLYNEFVSMGKAVPICQLCLRKLKFPKQFQKSIHFSCSNLNNILKECS